MENIPKEISQTEIEVQLDSTHDFALHKSTLFLLVFSSLQYFPKATQVSHKIRQKYIILIKFLLILLQRKTMEKPSEFASLRRFNVIKT